jgi:hypothetical protein
MQSDRAISSATSGGYPQAALSRLCGQDRRRGDGRLVGPGVGTHGFDESCDGRRPAPAGDCDQTDLARHLGLDSPGHQARHARRELGQEADTHAGSDHGLHPVFAFAATRTRNSGTAFGQLFSKMVAKLTIDTIRVCFAIELRHLHRVALGESMRQRTRNDEPLGIDRLGAERR